MEQIQLLVLHVLPSHKILPPLGRQSEAVLETRFFAIGVHLAGALFTVESKFSLLVTGSRESSLAYPVGTSAHRVSVPVLH